jgi:two-component system KDP operon response regulator KdpE
MRSSLTSEGYEVHDARTGEAALEEIRKERYDLVLLDMNMPGMDGLETCKLIRSSSEVAVIMLTVRNAEEDKIAALDAGADDYVTKPFSMPELLARIRASLRRVPLTAESSTSKIVIGDMEINVAARRLAVRAVDVKLTPKEFDLLLYLVENAGVPIPHGRLLQSGGLITGMKWSIFERS